jgi:drug/metabolite transporter (DMT)-like permease
MPLVAVVAGLVVLGERLTWNEPAGAVIVVGGAALTQMRSGSRRSGSRRVARADPVPDAGVVGDPAVPVDAHIRAERA